IADQEIFLQSDRMRHGRDGEEILRARRKPSDHDRVELLGKRCGQRYWCATGDGRGDDLISAFAVDVEDAVPGDRGAAIGDADHAHVRWRNRLEESPLAAVCLLS